MKPLGIKTENVEVDFAEGDTVTVIGGVWKDTVGVIQSMNHSKQMLPSMWNFLVAKHQ